MATVTKYRCPKCEISYPRNDPDIPILWCPTCSRETPLSGCESVQVRVETIELDEADYDTIQAEIAHRQARSRWPVGNTSPGLSNPDGPPKSGPILPDGDSCMVGAMLAEVVRDLNDYRAMYDVEHPKS